MQVLWPHNLWWLFCSSWICCSLCLHLHHRGPNCNTVGGASAVTWSTCSDVTRTISTTLSGFHHTCTHINGQRACCFTEWFYRTHASSSRHNNCQLCLGITNSNLNCRQPHSMCRRNADVRTQGQAYECFSKPNNTEAPAMLHQVVNLATSKTHMCIGQTHISSHTHSHASTA